MQKRNNCSKVTVVRIVKIAYIITSIHEDKTFPQNFEHEQHWHRHDSIQGPDYIVNYLNCEFKAFLDNN